MPRRSVFFFLPLFHRVPSPLCASQLSLFFSLPRLLHCAEQHRFRVLQTIFLWQNVEPDVNFNLFRAGAVANLMRTESPPKTACSGRNQLDGPVQEHHPEASTISACLSATLSHLFAPSPRTALRSSGRKQRLRAKVSFCSSALLLFYLPPNRRCAGCPSSPSLVLISPCPTHPRVRKGRSWLCLKPQYSWALNHYRQRTHQRRWISLTDCFLILFGILSWLHRKLIIKSCLCSIDYLCGSLGWEYEAWQAESGRHGWWKPLPRWHRQNCSAVTVGVEMKTRAPWSATGYPGSSLAAAILLTRFVPHATNVLSTG